MKLRKKRAPNMISLLKLLYDLIASSLVQEKGKVKKKQSKKLRRLVLKDNKRAEKQMVNKGVEVVDTPADVLEQFQESAEKMWDAGAGNLYSQAELDLVKKFLAAYRDSK